MYAYLFVCLPAKIIKEIRINVDLAFCTSGNSKLFIVKLNL